MDNFLYFSFLQGVFAFFAPCAVALLPAYIASFISRNMEESSSKAYLLLRGLKLALFSIAGILVIYAVAGTLIVVASHIIKEYLKWVAMGMGGVLIILGILLLIGKNISLNIHLSHKRRDNEMYEAFFFGIAYAVGALGCLFPLFLVVTTQAIAAPDIVTGASYILAYFFGISALMITTIILSIFAKDYLMRQMRRILPHINRFTGVLLILAGIYIIRYQMVLV